ncbi:MAG: HAD family hydrolase [Verrucomicrobiota bacterium]
MTQPPHKLNRRNVVALVWDFDKTLTQGYMQAPLFKRYGIDEEFFWKEVNQLPELYAQQGIRVSHDTVYLNHLLSFIKNGPMKGLRNADLRSLGAEIPLYPGLPDFFHAMRDFVTRKEAYRKHEIRLEHYVISTGLAEMIRGSGVAADVDGVFACEFVEGPFPPYYSEQSELEIERDFEITQIGTMVDNTIKTRYLFEINKGTNKHPEISVNAKMAQEDRRVPFTNMIYVADGPSDVPCFSLVRKNGGLAYAVYDPTSEAEFAQNDRLREDDRVDHFGPADYQESSATARWLKLQVGKICDRIVEECEAALSQRDNNPPQHLHREEDAVETTDDGRPQSELFSD